MKVNSIRPANMRTVHGIMNPNEPSGMFTRKRGEHSVSAVMVTEEVLADPLQCSATGSGMDAPEDLPTGSVKAFFKETCNSKVAFGFCQRTTARK